MLKIKEIRIENSGGLIVTDCAKPRFTVIAESSRENVNVVAYRISVASETGVCWDSGRVDSGQSAGIEYAGEELAPYTEYTVRARLWDNGAESAAGEARFETGKLSDRWKAEWITCASYRYGRKVSPVPMLFRKEFQLEKKVRWARIYSTALGCYELKLNGIKVGRDYLAPGYTSYFNQLPYQTYDITGMLKEENDLKAIVSGGWAAGRFGLRQKNKAFAEKQCFMAEIRLGYEDGSTAVIATDSTWKVSMEGRLRRACIYDGEVYDATVDEDEINYEKAAPARPRKRIKRIVAAYAPPVTQHEEFSPISVTESAEGALIYDFGQNCAGMIRARIRGREGQRIRIRHAEVLVDGELFTGPLRMARARIEYLCCAGEQEYSPSLTYMGFRYAEVKGIAQKDIELKAVALYSDLEQIGEFTCSNELLNRLQSNIVWSGKSNFVDIPTDCPQRDERLGWTGDIAVFAATACFNFNMTGFLDKWLNDLRYDQKAHGGIPFVIPAGRDGFPAPTIAGWGDSCILVPWASYLYSGDIRVLKRQYKSMKRFLKAVERWAALFSIGDRRYIWRLPFGLGDWCAPGEAPRQWLAKNRWIATAYFANSCGIMEKIATLLGKSADAQYYSVLRKKIIRAYRNVFTDRKGFVRRNFQTAYVCPLHFGMTEGEERANMADNLVKLIEEADNHLTTGFLGTPYILFALSDNGYLEKAYELLLQESCPGWLYEVKAGATSIWERWDALRSDGTVNIGSLTKLGEKKTGERGMVSFNHYANGAVGDWLYRRVAGIEAISPGYKRFRVRPLPGGGLTYARGAIKTNYGPIVSDWKVEGRKFTLEVAVPVNTSAEITLPGGDTHQVGSGKYTFSSYP